MSLLEVKNLKVEFGDEDRAFRAVDGVSFAINSGEILCLVGESGCGKSVSALSIARLLASPPARYAGGEILLDGRDVLRMSKQELQQVRGGVVSYVFQDPGACLNPVLPIGTQVKEGLRLHRREAVSDNEVIRLLRLVGIPSPEMRVKDFPHRLSGGMQQRVMIAMAVASYPKLLIADEPTTALDASIQSQIVELLRDLRQRLGTSILLITHNLGIVADIADRVAVMYAGQIMEMGSVESVLSRTRHPYTRALLKSVPRLGTEMSRLVAIPGSVPSLGTRPDGCLFHPRCSLAQSDCARNQPDITESAPGHWIRCPYWNL